MKNILIINGHPNKDSLNWAIVAAYKKGAVHRGSKVKEIVISELEFDPNLEYGYQKRKQLEPDLVSAWEKIVWADHLVWVHPVWWGGLPAITKGFIDRLFLSNFVFKYRENSMLWDKLLKGKTAHIITTLDQSGWYYQWVYGRPSVNQLKRCTLEFCGITPVKVTYIGIVRNSKESTRNRWLEKIEQLAFKS